MMNDIRNVGTICAFFLLLTFMLACDEDLHETANLPLLKVSENRRFLEHRSGQPFFWIGGTSWGMSEWLTREDIIHYLDDRSNKDFNLIQICTFWGKRVEDPVRFTLNPENAYGFRAFKVINGVSDPLQPHVVDGGSAEQPNDYWDHVEFILREAGKREMMVALLPVWGRRYVNASPLVDSAQFFSIESMKSFGYFLADRYRDFKNIIWVLGGDVQADANGDFLSHYRAMAEGIIAGITGAQVRWDERSPLWDHALMTYHPDGRPMKNSSTWFHDDPWLDFHMIETHKHRDSVYGAVAQDFNMKLWKPTVMGEPDYEGWRPNMETNGLHMRRQAFHSFFAGACGFTYGGKIDRDGNGPLWSPYQGWKRMLDMEGALSMRNIRQICLTHDWPYWEPDPSILGVGTGAGELQKVAVRNTKNDDFYIYFPDSSPVSLNLGANLNVESSIEMKWFNPASTDQIVFHENFNTNEPITVIPPEGWLDAVLVLSLLD